MTKEQMIDSMVRIFRKFKEQGADVVYGARGLDERVGLALEPFAVTKGSDRKPENVELRTEGDVRAWLG